MLDCSDEYEDVLDFLAAFLRLADQDAELVATYLRSLGFKASSSFPQNALLKLSVFLRLRLWERAGVVGGDEALPASDEVLADVIGELSGKTVRFGQRELGQRVCLFALGRLTWPQTSGMPFLIEDQSAATDVLDEIAALLWEFRELGIEAIEDSRKGDSGNQVEARPEK